MSVFFWAYDDQSAESITGQYDNCLFSLHKPQRIGKTMGEDEKDGKWTKMVRFPFISSFLTLFVCRCFETILDTFPLFLFFLTGSLGLCCVHLLTFELFWIEITCPPFLLFDQARMRIDGLPIDHLQGATTTGPLAWITAGKLDGVIDIKFPRHPDDDVDFTSVLSEIIDNVQEIASSSSTTPSPTFPPTASEAKGGIGSIGGSAKSREVINPGQRPLGKPALVAPEVSNWRELMLGKKSEQEMAREVVMDIDLRFRDLKAAVPFRTGELSYVNSALIRPIVAFIKCVLSSFFSFLFFSFSFFFFSLF